MAAGAVPAGLAAVTIALLLYVLLFFGSENARVLHRLLPPTIYLTTRSYSLHLAQQLAYVTAFQGDAICLSGRASGAPSIVQLLARSRKYVIAEYHPFIDCIHCGAVGQTECYFILSFEIR